MTPCISDKTPLTQHIVKLADKKRMELAKKNVENGMKNSGIAKFVKYFEGLEDGGGKDEKKQRHNY